MGHENVLDMPEENVNVTVLDALGWIDQAWRDVSPETIKKCFQRCGFGTTIEQTAPAETIDDIIRRYADFDTLSADDAIQYAQFDNEISK